MSVFCIKKLNWNLCRSIVNSVLFASVSSPTVCHIAVHCGATNCSMGVLNHEEFSFSSNSYSNFLAPGLITLSIFGFGCVFLCMLVALYWRLICSCLSFFQCTFGHAPSFTRNWLLSCDFAAHHRCKYCRCSWSHPGNWKSCKGTENTFFRKLSLLVACITGKNVALRRISFFVIYLAHMYLSFCQN